MNKADLTTKAYHGRPRSGRNKKFYSYASAAEYIGALSPGCEIFGLTKGQFSLFDVVEVLLNTTGPADVVISTWTAAGADTARAKEFLNNGAILSCRWLIDPSFISRQSEYCQMLVHQFGHECIRTIKNHAKFIIVTNDQWHFVVRTSMNMNANPRMESFEISEDSDFAAYFLQFVDMVFANFNAKDNFDIRSDLKKIIAFDAEPETAALLENKENASFSFNMLELKQKTAQIELEHKTHRAKYELNHARIEELKRLEMEKVLIHRDTVADMWRAGLKTLSDNVCPKCAAIISETLEKI
jgi:hypothetical protein